MADIKLLQSIIDDSGMTMVALANKTSILRATLYNRLAGKGEFTASEITALTKVLHLTKQQREDIFLS